MVELGAGLRTYTVGDRSVLDGYLSEEMCSGGRGQALIPWPNRLRDGRFEWDGHGLQTALTEPGQHNAIHGLVRWAPWTVTEQSASTVRLQYRLYPQPGWPWILDIAVTYSLTNDGLEVHTTAVNLPGGPGRCPFGAGWHPYLYAFGGLVDDAVLIFDAATVYAVDEAGCLLARPRWRVVTSISARAAASALLAWTRHSPILLGTQGAGPSWSSAPGASPGTAPACGWTTHIPT